MCAYVYIHRCIHVYIYIYIYREREIHIPGCTLYFVIKFSKVLFVGETCKYTCMHELVDSTK